MRTTTRPARKWIVPAALTQNGAGRSGGARLRTSTKKPGVSWLTIGVLGVVGLIAPTLFFGGSDYGFNFLISLVVWGGLAVSWNAFSGMTGYLSLGHAAFFGAGAYTVAILQPLIGAWPALIAACLVAGLIGLLLGFVTLRLRGLFFTMATIGIAETLRLGIMLTPEFTGGGTGLTLSGLPSYATIFYVSFVALLVVLGLMLTMMASVHGARLTAIRNDEEALGAVGIAVNKYKIFSFSVSVMAAGFFGGIYAMQVGFVQPDSVFPILISLTVVIMCFLGGVGTMWGPLAGTLVLSLVREGVWLRYPTVWDLVLGVILVVIVLAMPSGLIGFVGRLLPASRRQLL